MRTAALAIVTAFVAWFPGAGAVAEDKPKPPEERTHAEGGRDAQADYEAAWGYQFYTPVNPHPQKREMPDYDGRGKEPVTLGEGLLWIPRLLLLPVYFATDQLVRRPLGTGITRAEEEEIPTRLVDAFRFGPEQKYVIYPTFSFDFGLRTTIGLISRFGDIPAEHWTLNGSFAFSGKPWVAGSVGTTYADPGKNWTLDFDANATRRRDGLFFGIGNEISDENEASFNWVGYEASAAITSEPFRRSMLGVSTGYRYRRFGDDVSGDNTTIPNLVEMGNLSELPPGFEEGYSIWFVDARLRFDTREPRPAPGSGFQAIIGANFGLDPARGDSDSIWLAYGASITGFWDVSKVQHVFSLKLVTVLTTDLRGEVPFWELPALSGNGPLSGFVGRYLTGESGIAVSFDYTWPVWLFLDGRIHFAVGNVFDEYFDGFAFDALRMSVAAGLAAVGSGDHLFELLFGFGTDTFANGPSIQSVRIVIGASRDF